MNEGDKDGRRIGQKWREVTKRCLIATFHSHKGGQGRTLACAHTAVMLKMLARTSKSANILLVDLDWEAPGLSYMFSADALPEGFKLENEKAHAEGGGWYSTNLLQLIARAVKENTVLSSALSRSEGVPGSDKELGEMLRLLRRDLGGMKSPGATPSCLEIRTPEIEGGPREKILLLPARPVCDVRSAYETMVFDASLFVEGTNSSDKKGPIPISGEAFLRLFALFLIDTFELDYLLIDCRSGMTPLGYITSSRLADVTFIPTTTYNQALDGANALSDILVPSKERLGSGPPYGPEKIIIFYSNVSKSAIRRDVELGIELSPEVLSRVRSRLVSSRRVGKPIILPHVEMLSANERFVNLTASERLVTGALDEAEVEREALYLRGIGDLARETQDAYDAKVRSRTASDFFRKSDERFDAGIARNALLTQLNVVSSKTVRILVEKGPFGEEPFLRLLKSESLGRDGLRIQPVPIEHRDLFRFVTEGEINWNEIGEGLDLVSFPHYMLGHLAGKDAIHPLALLDDVPADDDFEYLTNNFYLADELCRIEGTAYAFPFSLLRKLLLIKAHSLDKMAKGYERQYGEAFELERCGWRDVQRLLDLFRKTEGHRGGEVVLETDFSGVGVWYDWLEFVYSFGGADFDRQPRESLRRGSDYTPCALNNPATIDGTYEYLRLIWEQYVPNAEGVLSWYDTMERFLADKSALMTVAWSDIVIDRWDDLRESTKCIPFPSATATTQDVIVEGWVIGVPSNVDSDRFGIIGAFMHWFLSRDVQEGFAKAKGSPSLRFEPDALESLPEILGIVHSVFQSNGALRTVAPKIKFREAPQVITSIIKELGEMARWSDERTKARVTAKMDSLAQRVAKSILKGKSRYVPRGI